MNDVLNGGSYSFPLGYDNVDWFVNEIIRIEKNCPSFLETLIEISLWQRKMKKNLKLLIFVHFVKKKIESDKVRDHCHLTSK